jgi:hypothetical protein
MIIEPALLEIENRLNDSQPGPWIAYIEGRDHESRDSFIKTAGEEFYVHGATHADLDFIANSRQDILQLIAEIRELKK